MNDGCEVATPEAPWQEKEKFFLGEPYQGGLGGLQCQVGGLVMGDRATGSFTGVVGNETLGLADPSFCLFYDLTKDPQVAPYLRRKFLQCRSSHII